MGIIDSVKRKINEQAKETRERRAYEHIVKEKAKLAYRQERGEQEIEFAREKAKLEKQAKLSRLKEQYKRQPKGLKGGNIARGLYGATEGMLKFTTAGFPQFQQPKGKSKKQKVQPYQWGF